MTPVERVVEALTAKGCNPRGGPTQWTARCPNLDAHKRGDRNPSLSVGTSPAGKALLHCHTGCTTPDIAQALGLAMRDLFPPDTPRPATGLAVARATYPYHDADGELVYEVVKIVDPDGRKTFRARTPDGNGGWKWSVAGVPRVVYHLPQVLAAVRAGRPVVICEGEKDAETASWLWADVHAATTCNPFGAGKWDASYNEWFRGAEVTVVADDDAVGRMHADMVRTHLSGVAATVTCVLPAAPHNDLTDHADAGLGRHQLRPLVDIDPNPDPPPDIFVDWDEFWRLDLAAEDWLIEPIIPRGRAVALYAPAKAGKSLLILSAIVPAALGASVWGAPPAPPIRVLYLDYEMTAADLRERLEMLGYGPDTDLSRLAYALIPILPPLDTAEGGNAVLTLAQAHRADLVVVDTLGRAAAGDENDADTMRAWYRHTGALLKAHDIAVARTDHAGKDVERGQRGSSAKNDDVDIVWRLDRLQDGLRVVRTHSRLMWVPESLALEFAEGDDGVWRMTRRVEADVWPAGTKQCADALTALGAPLDITARDALSMLREAGEGVRKSVVLAALKWRRRESEHLLSGPKKVGNRSGNRPSVGSLGTAAGTDDANMRPPGAEPPGNRPEPPSQPLVPGFRTSRYGTGTGRPGTIDPEDDLWSN